MTRSRSPKKTKPVTLEDLERVMGRKADKVSSLRFDPDSMSFSRTITFKLTPAPAPKRRKKP